MIGSIDIENHAISDTLSIREILNIATLNIRRS